MKISKKVLFISLFLVAAPLTAATTLLRTWQIQSDAALSSSIGTSANALLSTILTAIDAKMAAIDVKTGYTKVIGGAEHPLLSTTTIVGGDSILVIADITESVQVVINPNNVRVDFMPGKKLISTFTTGDLFTVNGTNFQSNNLSIRANGAMGAGNSMLRLNVNYATINTAYFELNNNSLSLARVVRLSGSQNDITASVFRQFGNYTNLYTTDFGGVNNSTNIRGQ